MDVLTKGEQSNFLNQKDIIYLDGMLTKDDNLECFRLYPNPKNKNAYYKIKKEYVVGEIHPYETEKVEKLGLGYTLGFTPNNSFSMYQIPLKKKWSMNT